MVKLMLKKTVLTRSKMKRIKTRAQPHQMSWLGSFTKSRSSLKTKDGARNCRTTEMTRKMEAKMSLVFPKRRMHFVRDCNRLGL